ncbi:hypothetical protein AGMMS49965_15660 [Bacteroidia bacterium]|nr:hypothetical protein AGMMS49965_15660 [Bacteroidia bacterium]
MKTKKIISFFGLLLAMGTASAVFTSCSDGTPEEANTTLSVDKTAISATATEVTYSLAVTSNSAWTISSDVGWCTISPTSGKGNGTVAVNVADNTATSNRSATITVTAGTITKTVTITQAAANATLALDKTAISAPSAAANYPIAVTSNVSWTAAVGSDAGWCTISPSSGTNNGTITVNATENTTTSSRWAIITVTAGATTQTVIVTQAAVNATLTLDKTAISATPAAANYPIAVTSNVSWTATVSSDAEWCTISPTSAISGTIMVNVTENSTTNSRSAMITVTTGTETQTVIVTQEAANATLTLDNTEISATSAVANYPIAVTSNVFWTATVSSDAEWCTISPTFAIGNGTIMVNVTENITMSSRSAMITVTAGTATQTVIVMQEAANATLTLDNTEISAMSAATNYPIAVTSNVAWMATVSSDAIWCTISPTSAIGSGTIMVNVTENTTTNSRSATITVTTGTVMQTVIVTQEAAAASSEIEMVTVAGGTTTLNGIEVFISSFQIGKYEVTQKQWQDVMGSNPSYFKGDNLPVETVSHDDIQTFLTKLNAQTGKNYRLPTEAEWEYAAKGGQSTHNYEYSGSNTLDDVAWYRDNSSIKTHIVGTKAANELGIYDMSGNVCEWCSDWYGNYPSGANNPMGATTGSYRVYRGGSWSYDAFALGCRTRNTNAPGDRLINLGFRLVLPLTENSTLSVDKTAISATFAAASYPIAVTSNVAWMATVSSDAMWCTISPTSAIGSGTIMVNVTTTTNSRSATITVTTGTVMQTVIVTQEAENATLTLDKTSIPATSATANYTVDVTSNSTWAVSSNVEWCTINSPSGTNNGTFTVNVAANTTTRSRSATITVTAGAVIQTVIVTQAAANAPFEPEMVTVEGGSITLNGTSVTLSSFQIGKYEVTQKQWWDVMGSWPSMPLAPNEPPNTIGAPISSAGVGDNYPIYFVTHYNILSFLSRLNSKTGKNYRLPTEAEWEYAAKGGQSTHNYQYSGSNTINDVAWYQNNRDIFGNYLRPVGTHPVGTKAANELGIYDMSGNVWEWCSDWYDSTYPSSANNPTGATFGSDRVMRGGGWLGDEDVCRVSARSYSSPGSSNPSSIYSRGTSIGFRLVLPL